MTEEGSHEAALHVAGGGQEAPLADQIAQEEVVLPHLPTGEVRQCPGAVAAFSGVAAAGMGAVEVVPEDPFSARAALGVLVLGLGLMIQVDLAHVPGVQKFPVTPGLAPESQGGLVLAVLEAPARVPKSLIFPTVLMLPALSQETLVVPAPAFPVRKVFVQVLAFQGGLVPYHPFHLDPVLALAVWVAFLADQKVPVQISVVVQESPDLAVPVDSDAEEVAGSRAQEVPCVAFVPVLKVPFVVAALAPEEVAAVAFSPDLVLGPGFDPYVAVEEAGAAAGASVLLSCVPVRQGPPSVRVEAGVGCFP